MIFVPSGRDVFYKYLICNHVLYIFKWICIGIHTHIKLKIYTMSLEWFYASMNFGSLLA